MAERVVRDHFRHECGRFPKVRRRTWKCPVCERTWEPEGSGAWRSEPQGQGEITSVTMRYPDGRERTFDVT